MSDLTDRCPSTTEYEIETFADDVLVTTETLIAECVHPAGHAGPHDDGAWFEWDGVE